MFTHDDDNATTQTGVASDSRREVSEYCPAVQIIGVGAQSDLPPITVAVPRRSCTQPLIEAGTLLMVLIGAAGVGLTRELQT
jgi:hypothetical protein